MIKRLIVKRYGLEFAAATGPFKIQTQYVKVDHSFQGASAIDADVKTFYVEGLMGYHRRKAFRQVQGWCIWWHKANQKSLTRVPLLVVRGNWAHAIVVWMHRTLIA